MATAVRTHVGLGVKHFEISSLTKPYYIPLSLRSQDAQRDWEID